MISDESKNIPIDVIDDPKKPLRSTMEEGTIDELMHSLSVHGLIHPIRVKATGTRFEVIIGHRRIEAARRLHWPTIACIVTTANQNALREMQIHENIHRLDLKPSEEAAIVQELHERGDWSNSRIATACGRSITWVQERLAMAEWPTGLADMVDQKIISITVAHILNTVEDDTALGYMANQAASTGCTAQQARAWVSNHRQKPWQLPTKEEMEAAREALAPPPVPMAICAGCELQASITIMATSLLCPTCQRQLPNLRRINP